MHVHVHIHIIHIHTIHIYSYSRTCSCTYLYTHTHANAGEFRWRIPGGRLLVRRVSERRSCLPSRGRGCQGGTTHSRPESRSCLGILRTSHPNSCRLASFVYFGSATVILTYISIPSLVISKSAGLAGYLINAIICLCSAGGTGWSCSWSDPGGDSCSRRGDGSRNLLATAPGALVFGEGGQCDRRHPGGWALPNTSKITSHVAGCC